MSAPLWASAGALTLLAGALVALRCVAGVARPRTAGAHPECPPLPCDLPGALFTTVLIGFGAGQFAAGLPVHIGPGQFLLLCAPFLLTAVVRGSLSARRPEHPAYGAAAALVALVSGFLVVGLAH
ncbi:hypothetical protein [Streptomyces sp. NBC_01205]|uniref:hypothetical protein n=1 Tax=Streptomyces sp. NBC_01205 TaxID=2903771 RepID=UPI002E134274|nr:hypothetical protein OG573_27740 [Streptomyces sp. NBC_01205]